jgi:hypothetical protein
MRGPGTSKDTAQRYVPALRYRWLTRFYDPILRATLKEEKLKGLLVGDGGRPRRRS